jgi:hypothetical protein
MVEVPPDVDPTPVTLQGDAAELVVGVADGGPALGPVAVLDTTALLALRARLRPARR